MATESNLVLLNFPAAGDLSTKQYHCVSVNSSGQVAVATGAGEKVVGVLQNTPSAAGRVAVVAVSGKSKIVLDATLAKGAWVGSSADGQAAAPGTGYALGVLELGGDAGQIGEIIITHSGVIALT